MGGVGKIVDAGGDTAATDYRGNPPDKSTTGGWLGAGLIAGVELAERICVMGISMNLVTYLVGDLNLSSSKSANIVTNFMGTLYLLALIGGFLADAKLGRYLTVAIFATVATLGVGLLTIATILPSMRPPHCDLEQRLLRQCIKADGRQLSLLYAALYVTALGAGAVKANVSGFGSDQFDTGDPKEERAMVFFFNRFYFFISLGSLFAVTVLVYVQVNVGRGWGYGISAAAMAVATVVLLAGTRKYRFRKAQGSPLSVVGRVLAQAWRKRGLPAPAHPSELHQYYDSKVPHTELFSCMDKAAIPVADEGTCSTMTEVEEVKMILKLIPIWSTSILFWTVYSQMTTFTVEQGTYMDRRLTSSSTFVVPSASVSVFLFATVLLFTSLNDKLILPVARSVTGNPRGLTSLQRVALGLVFSTFAMVVSAVVERKRRAALVNDTVRISVFWLVPQYFLVGAGEAFAYVGQLEFFITEAPERMKSMSTGLFLATLSMGFFMSSVLVTLVDVVTGGEWIRNNYNKGKLDYFYWMLAVLGVVNFAVFLVFAKRHQYKGGCGRFCEVEVVEDVKVKQVVEEVKARQQQQQMVEEAELKVEVV